MINPTFPLSIPLFCKVGTIPLLLFLYIPVRQLRNGLAPPCEHCEALLNLHTFQVQLGRKMPADENLCHVPKAHRCEELGEIYLKYKGVKQLLDMVCPF